MTAPLSRKTAIAKRFCAMFLAVFFSSSVNAQLPESLRQAIQSQSLPADAMGIWVKPVDSAVPIVSHNADRLFNPASTIKVATTLAALLELGPAYTWPTSFRSTAPVENGVLRGDLIIRGTGDPGAVSEEHWRMLRDLQRMTGLRRIEGNVILDASYFMLPTEDPGAFDGQPYRAYNQLAYALHVNSNSIRFHIIPEGNSIRIEAEPPLPGLKINNQLTRGNGNCDAWQRGIRYDVGRNEVTFSGAYPVNCGNYELLRTAVAPDFNAAELFRLHWAQWGGEITGDILSHQGAALNYSHTLMVHHSRPLADLIKVANKWSHNVMTRHMALSVGASRMGPPATLEKARVSLIEVLREAGVNTQGMFIDNGSGLSRVARISPNQLGQILQVGWDSPRRPEFISSLSISGIDGTTRRQYRNNAAAGQKHLKTGLLNQVSAITGYVRNRCNEDVMVVLLINHPEAHLGHGTRMQQTLMDWVYQSAGCSN
ncbi:D-alanyl-D-alanine carboxypeptidase/D-alanyl-D-alanine-endopeptidase [Nitrincola schmidtii]|uniref:D-alanyl-D-alanine carboxypeptidase/D-alanyl-D-alanine endopeptidase n=1 Tax=Nitrincola schmidtii TaxID=1730894 RepID=UPI0019811E3A|nr:D-alanyl-D-alanine carboxypeptidase/D-alanyl-D-alanine-endopeptidase [Nitrincola schmidtii]